MEIPRLGLQRVYIVLLFLLYCIGVMVTVSKNPSTIFQWGPDRVAEELMAFVEDGTLDRHTLVVWDVDDTLIQAGSDYLFSGAKFICPRFSEIIRETQEKGTRHIALTNASPFDNQLKIEGGVLKLTSVPQIASIYSGYLPRTGDADGPLTFEKLRIDGLKHIGIDLNRNGEWQNFPRELEILQLHHDIRKDSNARELSKVVSDSGETFEMWIDARDQSLYRHIQWDAIVPGFEPNDSKRHFIQSDSSFSEVLCRPIFSGGIIFCNFINFYTQCFYGYTKGDILQLFLEEYEKQTGQKFSNVIFIDDTLLCVENVMKVMEKIGMPCIGINILSHPEGFGITDDTDLENSYLENSED